MHCTALYRLNGTREPSARGEIETALSGRNIRLRLMRICHFAHCNVKASACRLLKFCVIPRPCPSRRRRTGCQPLSSAPPFLDRLELASAQSLVTLHLLVYSKAFVRAGQPSSTDLVTYLRRDRCDVMLGCILLLLYGVFLPDSRNRTDCRLAARSQCCVQADSGFAKQMATWLGRRSRSWQRRPRRSKGRERSAATMASRRRCWRTPSLCLRKHRQEKHS